MTTPIETKAEQFIFYLLARIYGGCCTFGVRLDEWFPIFGAIVFHRDMKLGGLAGDGGSQRSSYAENRLLLAELAHVEKQPADVSLIVGAPGEKMRRLQSGGHITAKDAVEGDEMLSRSKEKAVGFTRDTVNLWRIAIRSTRMKPHLEMKREVMRELQRCSVY